MRISPLTYDADLIRLNRVNADLSNFLKSSAAKSNDAAQTGFTQGFSNSFSAGDSLGFRNAGLLSETLGPLLSSVSTAAESVGEGRLKLKKVRAQLETILNAASKARKSQSANTTDGQLAINRAIAEINRLSGTGSQPASGGISTQGGRAELTLLGAPGGIVKDDATFRVSGSLGDAEFAVSKGDSLNRLASSINQLTTQTGVAAFVADGNLVFQSIESGSEAAISVLPVEGVTRVTGVDSSQLLDFTVNSIRPNSIETLSGNVSASQSATLSYDGNAAGLIFDSGEFTIKGGLGSASVTFDPDASLTDLANLINQRTTDTGVEALVGDGRLVFRSLESGSAAEISVGLSYNELSVSGVNPAQVAAFDVQSLQSGSNNTISGIVKVAAEQAEQTYLGQAGRVTNSASFEVSGDLGSETISIQRGELLTDVADRVNQKTTGTGVTATVDGDKLVFRSVEYGGNSSFAVQVTRLTDIAGVNQKQISQFQVDAIAPNSNETISGRVEHAAEQAELKYHGGGGQVQDDATFLVSGDQGSASFTVTAGESLTDVADRVNQQTAATGVTARVVDDDLFFNSITYGSSAQAYLEVTSGKFDVSGGARFNDGRVDYGKDAEATINGVDYVGDGNRFTFSEGFGTFTVDLAGGFEGDFDTVSVVSAATDDVINVSEINSSQFSGFQVTSIDPGDFQTIAGEVRETAERATLKYSGDAGALVKEDARFAVTGNQGTASFTVTAAESLADVAARINQQTAATGVTATVDNNDLFLSSVQYGTNAQVYVEVTSGTFDVSGGSGFNGGEVDFGEDVGARINGVDYFGDGNRLLYNLGSGQFTIDFAAGFNGHFDTIEVASTVAADNLTDGENAQATGVSKDQFVRFEINQAVADSVQTVAGRVVDTAERAQLQYGGDAGSVIKEDAVFTLSGNQGLETFAVTEGESLSAVAQRINAQTVQTGVVASVDNNDLFFTSVDYGSNASVSVEVTSGTFDVTGGADLNGAEVDFGKDVKAEINGVDYFGNGNELTFSDQSGSFSVEFVAGFEGDFNSVTVGSINDAFELSGRNGDGTASGVDAKAVINGQSLTADGNQFLFSDSLGTYRLEVTPGYSGAVDPIDASSTQKSYAIDGGNGDGTANGQDAQVVVNGQTLVGLGDRYTFESNLGSYDFEFVEGFTGGFGEIEVSSSATGSLDLVGGNGDGTARGSAPVIASAASETQSSPTISLQVFEQLRFLGSFSLGLDVASLGGSSGYIKQLASGGSKSGLGENAEDAVRITQQALTYVSNLEQLLQNTTDRGVDSIAGLTSNVTGQVKQTALALRNGAPASGFDLPFSSGLDQRQVLNLLQTT